MRSTCVPEALANRRRAHNGFAHGLDALFADGASAVSVQGAELPMDGPAAVFDAASVDSTFQCHRRAAGASHAGWPTAADLFLQPGARWKPTEAFAAVQQHRQRLTEEVQEAKLQEERNPMRGKKRRAGGLPQDLASFSAVKDGGPELLHQLAVLARPLVSGETGFASGTSALAVLTALNTSATHVAIDPFQPAYATAGLRAMRDYTAANRPTAPRVALVNETAAFGLAWLSRRAQCFDLFFMDDGHKLDDNIVELYAVSKLLSIGGLLILHDTWLPAVKKTMAFIDTNLAFLEHMVSRDRGTQNMAIYVKRRPDMRAWNDFKEF